MEKKKIDLRFSVISSILLLAAISRLIPHPSNFSPIGGMALFGAAYYSKKYWAFIIPVLTMWLSDLVVNNVVYGQYFPQFVWFYEGYYWTYSAFLLITLVGLVLLKRIKLKNLLAATLSASLIFYLVSNFGVWFSTNMYPKNISGLIACYVAGLPFLKNTLMGDFVYTTVLFGLFEYAVRSIPTLQLKRI
ncbi:MAG: hypothetical protein JXQ69_06445 [Paludibacteraceae bacterium]|nr:hypothetical protein [Paludibacteraceae bacterium]MBN2787949.1 hypothetical protein [Paludibacteraceae bacterium]